MVCVYSFELQFLIKVIMLQVDMEDNIPDGQKKNKFIKGILRGLLFIY